MSGYEELLKAIRDVLKADDSLSLLGRASTVQSVIKLVVESGTSPEWAADFLRQEVERWQRKLADAEAERAGDPS